MDGMFNNEILSWLVALVASFGAAFAGAWYAFRLNVRQKKQEEDRRRVAQGNIALYTLFNMWNILLNYNKHNIIPHKDADDCWLNMPRTPKMTTGLTSFDAEGLVFLLTLGEETANVYAQVLFEEQEFGEIIGIIEYRNKILNDVVEPKFEEAGIKVEETALTQEEAVNIIGDFHSHRLKQLTDGIISRVGDSIKSLEDKRDSLTKTMKSLYPKEKFLTFYPSPKKEGEDSGG